jgi:hypothetical protein
MHHQTTVATWTAVGITALPIYSILLVVGTLTPQPDQVADPEGWAQFVSTTHYMITHIATNLLGPILAILGAFALTVMITARSPRLAPTGMVLAVAGQVLFSVPAVISTFVTPAIGHAYLQGDQDIMALTLPDAATMITVLALMITVAGNIMLGTATAKSTAVPRWSGIGWAAGTVTFYLLGAALGMATTGASLLTQPIGAVLLTVSGAAMARAAFHRRSRGDHQPAHDPIPTTDSRR